MKQYLNIPFKHAAGHDLCADFYIPEDVMNPPVILWIHGGGWKDLNRKWCLVMPQLTRGYAICSGIPVGETFGLFPLHGDSLRKTS